MALAKVEAARVLSGRRVRARSNQAAYPAVVIRRNRIGVKTFAGGLAPTDARGGLPCYQRQ